MTDQEYEKELAALMNGEPAGQKKNGACFPDPERSGAKSGKC